MTDKRFVIKLSAIVTDGFVIIDKEKEYTFPVLDSTLNYMFCKALNELHEEKQSVIDWIDRKIEEIKPYNSELCRATLLELKELLE